MTSNQLREIRCHVEFDFVSAIEAGSVRRRLSSEPSQRASCQKMSWISVYPLFLKHASGMT